MSQYFDLYDVKESSYHTFISRLDLHICNDSSSMDEGQLDITHRVHNVINMLSLSSRISSIFMLFYLCAQSNP